MTTNDNQATRQTKFMTQLNVHKALIGFTLATYGAFYLYSIILSGWTIDNWGRNITNYMPFPSNSLLSNNYINPILFATSLPSLVLGTTILCAYSIQNIKTKASKNKEYTAIILTFFGFAYQLVGAWPLQPKEIFFWEWQKQIIAFGPVFAWTLYLLSLIALIVGAISLLIHSRIYNKEHPEFKTNINN